MVITSHVPAMLDSQRVSQGSHGVFELSGTPREILWRVVVVFLGKSAHGRKWRLDLGCDLGCDLGLIDDYGYFSWMFNHQQYGFYMILWDL